MTERAENQHLSGQPPAAGGGVAPAVSPKANLRFDGGGRGLPAPQAARAISWRWKFTAIATTVMAVLLGRQINPFEQPTVYLEKMFMNFVVVMFFVFVWTTVMAWMFRMVFGMFGRLKVRALRLNAVRSADIIISNEILASTEKLSARRPD